jgi:flavodoxin
MGSTMVVYDSAYGNTEKIAQAIGNMLGPQEDARVVQVNDVTPDQFTGLKLLVVGSPTQRFRPTIGMTTLLKSIPQNGLKGVKVAAFDTRLTEAEINKVRILAFFVRIYGYAAKPIASRLKKKGGELIMPPEGFYVEGMEGPLVAGELERAVAWAQGMKDHALN